MNYNKAFFEKAFGIFSQLPASDSNEIVFAGKSNVGKSSLLNKIFSRKSLARVSSVPGKTITINFYDVDGVKFVDLPGYGYAKISKLVVILVDIRHSPSKDDLNMIDFVKQMNLPFIIALTKSDKLNKTEYKNRMSLVTDELGVDDSIVVIPFSSKTGQGVEEVKKCIENSIS